MHMHKMCLIYSIQRTANFEHQLSTPVDQLFGWFGLNGNFSTKKGYIVPMIIEKLMMQVKFL